MGRPTDSLSTDPDRDARVWSSLTIAVVALVSLAGLLTFRDYGLTWDQAASHDYGDIILEWYRTGFQDRRALDYLDRRFYGGAYDVVAQLLVHLLRAPEFETHAFVSLACGVVGIVYAVRVARHLSGARAGFVAACLLALTPSYYGHMFVNPRDIPLAAAFTATLYYGLESARALREGRIPRSHVAAMGVALGFALALRIHALLVFGYLAAMLDWVVVDQSRHAGRFDSDRLRHALIALSGVLVVAWLVMLPFWPLAQVSTRDALAALRGSPYERPSPTLYGGRLVPTPDLPRSYVLVWFAITLPEAYFFCAAVIVFTAITQRRLPSAASSQMAVFLGLCLAFPLLLVTWARAPFYDGVRHLLFVMPVLAALVAAAFSWSVDRFGSPWTRRLTSIVLAALLASVVPEMIALHPYQSIYFNRLVAGGLPRAGRLYETDYWGQSYREAVLWLGDHYETRTPPVGVENCSNPLLSAYYIDREARLRGRFVAVKKGEGQIVLATTRFGCHRQPGNVLHVVARQGVPLAYVIERFRQDP